MPTPGSRLWVCVYYRVPRGGPDFVGNAAVCPVQGLVPQRLGSNGPRASSSYDEHLRTRSSQVGHDQKRGPDLATNPTSNVALPLPLPQTRQRSGE